MFISPSACTTLKLHINTICYLFASYAVTYEYQRLAREIYHSILY